MAWQQTHKEQTRQRILSSAGKLFTTQGYKQVSIDDVMKDAQLTRGAFYHHFNSKQALYSEAIVFAARQAGQNRQQKSLSLPDLIRRYLSMEHVIATEDPCPLAFLISDIGLQEEAAKQSYGKVLDGFVTRLSLHSGIDETKVLQAAITMIGGVALARSTASAPQAQNILDAAYCNALRALEIMK
ncbi:TetR/AcrR family transcriptional regulator [Motilimonas sp. E26]|uniref:TetR/AcrR family transcriptional regulator n=1 Tax=Motilimonas sp. E26 TaxID=2865674 RepID=UPI001E4E2C22|nr:TetR/AcrR family transcriptional regulator [Motilimonas sp. E26]MCE0557701.1 TetR family transcriptional regulator [Motilimonas sp. E26]